MTVLETPSRIEPCFLEQASPDLVDLTAEVVSAATTSAGRWGPAAPIQAG